MGMEFPVLQDRKFWRLVAHHLNVLNTTRLAYLEMVKVVILLCVIDHN